MALHLPRADPDRPALSREGTTGGRAERTPDHGRRPSVAAAAGRGPDDAEGAIQDARLLPTVRRGGERGGHVAGIARRDGLRFDVRTTRAADRPRPRRLDGEE